MRNAFRGLPALVDRWLKEHRIPRDCTIIVGMSGGRDSMALAACLNRIGQPVIAAHVNYGLRGDESIADQAFVEQWCQQMHIPVKLHAPAHVESTEGVQSAARKIRYQWFQTLKQEHTGLAFIATAHHADDQAETVLLHLIRSSDPLALAAMKPREDTTSLLRPFLHVSRSAITAWMEQEGIPFRDDSSNAKPDYLRNRLRHEILPLLEDIRAGSGAHIARWADRWQPISLQLKNEIDLALERCYQTVDKDCGILRVSVWKEEPLADEILYHLAQRWHISARAVPEIKGLCEETVQSGGRFESSHTTLTRQGDLLHWIATIDQNTSAS